MECLKLNDHCGVRSWQTPSRRVRSRPSQGASRFDAKLPGHGSRIQCEKDSVT